MRGLLVELSRLRARRAVVALVVAMLALTTLVLASVVYESRPLTADEASQAQQQYERERADAQPQIDACREDPEAAFGGPADEADCESLGPQLDWYTARPVLDLADQADATGPGIAILLAALAVLVGATFAGADWSSGSMTNQLLFRPRRLRLWATKAAAVLIGTVVAAAIVLAWFWGALIAVAQARDLEVADPVLREILLGSGRALALVAATALGGFALTMWLRRTGGTIGALFGFAVVSEVLVSALPFDRMSQWSLLNNLAAWTSNGTEVYDDSLCDPTLECNPFYTLSLAHGGAVLATLLVLALVVSVVTFKRRDIG